MGQKKVFYYKGKSGKHEFARGPFTKDELLEKLNEGVIDNKVFVKHEHGYWMPLHQYFLEYDEETGPDNKAWQTIKAKIEWDNLKTETKNTSFTATKKEQKFSSSTPPDEPIPPKGNEILTNILSYKKVIIAVCTLLALLLFFTKKDDNVKSSKPLPNSISMQGFVPAQPGKSTPLSQPGKPILPIASLITQPVESITPITTLPSENQQNQNIRIVRKIVYEYHQTHTYSMTDLFVCSDMAIDVWNMVKTKGINAIIVIGSFNKDVTNIREADHAWVSAEIFPDRFVALETTGGFLVCPDSSICPTNNPRYFQGWKFNNPRELKDAQDKLKHPCPVGYLPGSDLRCYPACGENTYCNDEYSVCVNGQCRGCKQGFYLGTDLRCHKL